MNKWGEAESATMAMRADLRHTSSQFAFPTAIALGTALAALGVALPWLGASPYIITLVYYMVFMTSMGQAWNLMSGFTGYISLGHGALVGVGSYAVVIAANRGLPLTVAIPIAMAAAMTASLIIGLPSLRIRGLAFAFATLFFHKILSLLVMQGGSFTGGARGVVLQEIFPLELAYVLMVVTAWALTVGMAFLRRSLVGMQLLAIKFDEVAAGIAGVPVNRYKLITFCASAAIAGLVGAVHAVFSASLFPQNVFAVVVILTVLIVPLIGGAGTALGPVVGAVLYAGLREVLQIHAPQTHLVVLGALIVVTILFAPGGVVGACQDFWERRKGEA